MCTFSQTPPVTLHLCFSILFLCFCDLLRFITCFAVSFHACKVKGCILLSCCCSLYNNAGELCKVKQDGCVFVRNKAGVHLIQGSVEKDSLHNGQVMNACAAV